MLVGGRARRAESDKSPNIPGAQPRLYSVAVARRLMRFALSAHVRHCPMPIEVARARMRTWHSRGGTRTAHGRRVCPLAAATFANSAHSTAPCRRAFGDALPFCAARGSMRHRRALTQHWGAGCSHLPDASSMHDGTHGAGSKRRPAALVLRVLSAPPTTAQEARAKFEELTRSNLWQILQRFIYVLNYFLPKQK